MVPDIDLVNKFSFSWMGTHGYPSYKTWSQNWPKLGISHIWAILNIFSKHSFFWIQWVPMGTHHPIAMKMKICLLIGCLGPSFITCIFLSNQQEKSLFSDSADPSIFSDKMAVTSVLLYLLLLYQIALSDIWRKRKLLKPMLWQFPLFLESSSIPERSTGR